MTATPFHAVDLQLGEHVCVPATSARQRWRVIKDVIVAGLRLDHDVLLLGDHLLPNLLADLGRQLPDTTPVQLQRQLRLQPLALTGVEGAVSARARTGNDRAGTDTVPGFNADGLLARIDREIDLCRRARRPGLRIIVDLSHLGSAEFTARLPRCETLVNAFYTRDDLLGVCLYDPTRFTRRQWRSILSAHPCAVHPDMNTMSTRLRCRYLPGSQVLYLFGEVDLANRAALHPLMAAATHHPGPLHIDGRCLRFADAAASDALLQVVRSRPEHPTTIICSPAIANQLRILNADAGTTLRIIEADDTPTPT